MMIVHVIRRLARASTRSRVVQLDSLMQRTVDVDQLSQRSRRSSIMTIRIGIVTVSDRASQGVYEDLGGPAIRALPRRRSCPAPGKPVPRLIPDEQAVIEATLERTVRSAKAAAWS